MITKQTSNITKLFPQPQLSQQADVGFHDDAVLHRVRAEAGPLILSKFAKIYLPLSSYVHIFSSLQKLMCHAKGIGM